MGELHVLYPDKPDRRQSLQRTQVLIDIGENLERASQEISWAMSRSLYSARSFSATEADWLRDVQEQLAQLGVHVVNASLEVS